MTKKIIAMMMLAALVLIPMNPKAAAATIEKARKASKYVTAMIDGTAYTISGTVNYDKKSGLAAKDYISWQGNVSHNLKICYTEYVLYYGKTKYRTTYLPYRNGHKYFFADKKVNAKDYSYAKLDMDTLAGKYTLRANE